MKKRRTTIIALLLIAALALGIGYAALSTEVKITGDIASSAVTFDVQFIDSVMDISSETTGRVEEIQALSSKGTTGSSMIHLKAAGLKEAGDKVTYTLTIQNKSDVTVTLTALQLIDADSNAVMDLNNTEALDEHFAPFIFAVEGCEAAQDLTPGATTTVKITITLGDTSNVASTHSYVLKAVAEPKNNTEEPLE